jgi:hypothetical protein
MNNFDELLYRLIRNNRRVIIPDIGAFITNVPEENTVFSPLLKYNDGFLEDELQKEGIANPAVFLRELAENIISVVERGQHFHIAGLGYFVKYEGISFEFERIDNDNDSEYSGDAELLEAKKKKNKLRISLALICLCLIILTVVIFIFFNIFDSKKTSNMFTSRKTPPDNQFVIIDRSDDCDMENYLQSFPQAASYHLVVACFEEKDNAEEFVLHCKKIGYDNAEILCLTTVLYTVTVGAFSSQDEAMTEKQKYDDRFGENSLIVKSKMILNN